MPDRQEMPGIYAGSSPSVGWGRSPSFPAGGGGALQSEFPPESAGWKVQNSGSYLTAENPTKTPPHPMQSAQRQGRPIRHPAGVPLVLRDETGPFLLCLPPKIHNPSLIMRKTPDKSRKRDSLRKYLTSPPQSRRCHQTRGV